LPAPKNSTPDKLKALLTAKAQPIAKSKGLDWDSTKAAIEAAVVALEGDDDVTNTLEDPEAFLAEILNVVRPDSSNRNAHRKESTSAALLPAEKKTGQIKLSKV